MESGVQRYWAYCEYDYDHDYDHHRDHERDDFVLDPAIERERLLLRRRKKDRMQSEEERKRRDEDFVRDIGCQLIAADVDSHDIEILISNIRKVVDSECIYKMQQDNNERLANVPIEQMVATVSLKEPIPKEKGKTKHRRKRRF